MELDDLKAAWPDAGQTTGGVSLDELIARLRRLRRMALWRDAREIVAAAVLFPVFAWIGWLVQAHEGPLAARLGVGIVMAGFLLIVAVLLWARRPAAGAGSSVVEHLRGELAYVDRQIFILDHAAWWAVAPVTVGVDLFVEGVRGAHSRFTIIYVVVTVAVGALLVWFNRRGAERLRHLREPLAGGLEALSERQTER